MLRAWSKDELIEVNGKFVEKEWAFPDLEGNQTAIMVRWVDGKWEFSLWSSAIDANDVEACGWEPCVEGDRARIISIVGETMSGIEEGA
jgi:hypothetical protein